MCILQKAGHQNKEIFAESNLNSSVLPMELPDGSQCSLISGVQHLGNEKHRNPGKILTAILSNYSFAIHLWLYGIWANSFGDDVCIFWV